MQQPIIDIRRTYLELDSMYGRRDFQAAGEYLRSRLLQAESLGDTAGRLLIENELLGYNRQYGSPAENERFFTEIPELIREAGFTGTSEEGTILVNLATAMVSAGRPRDALPVFERAGAILERTVDPTDRRMASFLNNSAAAFEAAGDAARAEECYRRAEGILSRNDHDPDLAVTWVNLASLYAKADPCDDRIQDLCDRCIELLDTSPYRDGYYYYTCRKCAEPLRMLGFFAAAAGFAEAAPPA